MPATRRTCRDVPDQACDGPVGRGITDFPSSAVWAQADLPVHVSGMRPGGRDFQVGSGEEQGPGERSRAAGVPRSIARVNVRLMTSIAVSGVLHAGLFVALAGLNTQLFAGLENVKQAGTLTVSIAPMESSSPVPSPPPAPGPPAQRDAIQSPVPDKPSDMEHHKSDVTPTRSQIERTTDDRAKSHHSRRVAATSAPRKSPPSSTRLARSEQANTTHDREKPRSPREPTPSGDQGLKGEAHANASSPHMASPGSGTDDSGRQAERTYLSELLEALSRYKHYPQSARLRGQEGTVVVALILRRDGTIDDVHIAQPSRYPLLNRAALRTVRQLDRFKPFPSDMHRASWDLTVPFQYAISDR